MKLLSVLFIFCSSIVWGQLPQIKKAGDSLVVKIDTIMTCKYDIYRISKGWEFKGQPNGIWHFYSQTSNDATMNYQHAIHYDNGKIASKIQFMENSHYAKIIYNHEGHPQEVKKYNTDNTLVIKEDYDGKNKKQTIIYHSNGNIQAEGNEKRVMITVGCDAGMQVFQRYGEWRYYDIEGNLIEVKDEKIKKTIFKEVDNKV